MALKINQIGRFDRRLKAQRLIVVQDDSGGFDEAWNDVYETWAYVSDIKSYRDQIELQNVNVSTFTVQMRDTDIHEVSKDIRFIYEGRNLILHGQPLHFTEGRKRYIQFILSEQV